MENRIIRLEIDKDRGQLLRLFYKGINLVGDGKGYMQSYDENGFMTPRESDLIITRNDQDVIDIGFAHKHDFAVDYEWHYVLRPDEPGFYAYIVWGPNMEKSGRHSLKQLNYALRLDPDLFTHFSDGVTRGTLPSPELLNAGKRVMDASYELADGTVYTKYNHSAVMNEHHTFHGITGPDHSAWVIMPSHEHLNGVPFNTELTLHQTGTTPILLRHVQAAHHGSGVAEFSTDDEPWQKWGGPWFYYFNEGGSMVSREEKARALSKRMAADWPFQWIRDERFAIERGTLRGRLSNQKGEPMEHARIVISKAVSGVSPSDFQQLWRGYRFFGWADEDGQFEIKNIWPAQYDLFAMDHEIPGRLVKNEIPVVADKTTDTGTLVWQIPETGRRLWQIGRLDRSASEFAYGDDFRHWGLWMEIADEYPKGIISIDADRGSAGDIPHMLAVCTKKDGTSYDPVLRIEFNVTERPREKTANLLIALADAIQHRSGSVDLLLLLNGEALKTVKGTFEHGGAVHRSGIRGLCQEAVIRFKASRLCLGQNVLEIRLQVRGDKEAQFEGAPRAAILLDALRLELK